MILFIFGSNPPIEKGIIQNGLVYAYGPKTGAAFCFFFSPVRNATEWTATQHVGWWGGVGCNDILELAHMVAATVNLYTWSMLR